MGKIVIRIPGTSSDLGSSINSLGLAFQLYSTVIVEEKTDQWRVNHALSGNIPHDSNNLIVQTILRINPRIAPHQLTVMSDIPTARGLGSSTAAYVAGVKIANALGRMHLSLDEQINLGSRISGHPECIASAMLGDLTASTFNGKRVTTVNAKMPQVSALAYMLNRRTQLNKSTHLKFSLAKMRQSIDISNVLIAAIMGNHWGKASLIMESNPIPIPKKLQKSPELKALKLIRSAAHHLGIYGSYLNSEMTAVITFGQPNELSRLHDRLNNVSGLTGTVKIMKIDRTGTTVRGE